MSGVNGKLSVNFIDGQVLLVTAATNDLDATATRSLSDVNLKLNVCFIAVLPSAPQRVNLSGGGGLVVVGYCADDVGLRREGSHWTEGG